jgi:hypothetical protein
MTGICSAEADSVTQDANSLDDVLGLVGLRCVLYSAALSNSCLRPA